MAEAARPGRTLLTAAVTTSQGGSLLPGQAKTHPALKPPTAPDVLRERRGEGEVKATAVLFYDRQ